MDAILGGYLRKYLSPDKNIVVVTVDATGVVSEVLKRQGLMPPSLVHAGQACLGALLIQSLWDPSENLKLELQWSLKGPFGNLYADVLGTGRVRGTIGKPDAVVSRMDEALGEGLLQVRRSEPPRMEYTGIVQSSGHVGSDLVEYLEKSEQRMCGVSLSVQVGMNPEGAEEPFYVKRAIGYLIHVLPQKTEARQLELMNGWHRYMEDLGPLSKWELETTDAESTTTALAHFLLPDGKQTTLYQGSVYFDCTCTEDRAARALALVQRQEASEGASAAPSAARVTVTCEFCGRKYDLTEGPASHS